MNHREWLALHMAIGVREKLLRQISSSIRQNSDVGLLPDVTAKVHSLMPQAERLEAELARRGIKIITPDSEINNPLLPPMLYAWGNLDLLKKPMFLIGGTRKPSSIGLKATANYASTVVSNGYVVLSGYAAGTDIIAHKTALESGGATVAFLSYGILHFWLRKQIKHVLTPDNFLAVSFVPPKLNWQAWIAFMRNEIMARLVDEALLVEVGNKGGTLHQGKVLLKMHKRVFVLNTHKPGAIYLIRKGSIPVGEAPHPGFPRVATSGTYFGVQI